MSAAKGDGALVREVVEALIASVDANELKRRLRTHFPAGTAKQSPAGTAKQSPAGTAKQSPAGTAKQSPAQAAKPRSTPPKADDAMSDAARKLQGRIGLADILDDTILEARSGDRAFPLRLFFGELVQEAGDDDVAFALASGLNLYFRATMPEESKVRVGLEVSRLYYRFAQASLDSDLTVRLSPLLAKLMSHDLDQLVLESVDHVKVFDSSVHERAAGVDETSASIRQPRSFLCRVAASRRTRFKALVAT